MLLGLVGLGLRFGSRESESYSEVVGVLCRVPESRVGVQGVRWCMRGPVHVVRAGIGGLNAFGNVFFAWT